MSPPTMITENFDLIGPTCFFFCAVLPQVVTVASVTQLLDPRVLNLDSQTIKWEPFRYFLVKNHSDGIDSGSVRTFFLPLFVSLSSELFMILLSFSVLSMSMSLFWHHMCSFLFFLSQENLNHLFSSSLCVWFIILSFIFYLLSFIFLSFYLFIFLSFYLSIFLSFFLILLFFFLSFFLAAVLSYLGIRIFLSFICLFLFLSLPSSVSSFICLFLHMSLAFYLSL